MLATATSPSRRRRRPRVPHPLPAPAPSVEADATAGRRYGAASVERRRLVTGGRDATARRSPGPSRRGRPPSIGLRSPGRSSEAVGDRSQQVDRVRADARRRLRTRPVGATGRNGSSSRRVYQDRLAWPRRLARSHSPSRGANRARLPATNGLVGDLVAALEQQLRDISEAELVAQPPQHREQHDIGRVLEFVKAGAGPLVEPPPAGAAAEPAVAEFRAVSPLGCRARSTVRTGHGRLLVLVQTKLPRARPEI